MTTAEFLAWGFVGAAGLAGSFFASGLETGFYSMNRVRLDVRAARIPPDHAARFLKDGVEHPDRIITTLLMGNNVFGYIAALAAAAILEALGYEGASLIAMDILVLTPLLLIFCEALPKEIFRVEADRLTYRFAWILWGMKWAFTVVGLLPLVVWIATAVSRHAANRVGAAPEGSALPSEPRRRIEALLKEGAAQGTLSASQATLVERALAMRGATVADEMVPWARVHTIPIDAETGRLPGILARDGHGYYPVVDRRGRVVGVLWQPLVFLERGRPLASLLREPARLQPGTPVLEAVAKVRGSAAPIGIIERGGRPLGMVTEKDLIEPLTGEI